MSLPPLTASATLQSQAVAGAWPQLANTPDRQGYTPETVNPAVMNTGYWNYNFAASTYETVARNVQAIINGSPLLVLVGTEQGHVYALNAATGGNPVWTFPSAGTIGPIIASVAATANTVYVPSMDGAVYALNLSTGSQLWKSQLSTDTGIGTAILLDNNVSPTHLVVGTRDGILWSLDPNPGGTGAIQWHTDLGSPILQSPATDGTRVFVGTMDMKFHGVSLSDGLTGNWTSGVLNGAGFSDYYPIVLGSQVFVRPVPATTEYSGELIRGIGNAVFDWSFSATNQSAATAAYDTNPSAYSNSFHVFDTSGGAHTGTSPIHWNFVGAHEGASSPGCVDVNQGGTVESNIIKNGNGELGFARLNLGTRQIFQVEPDGSPGGFNNRDENTVATCVANGVIWVQFREHTGDVPDGFFDLTVSPPAFYVLNSSINGALGWGYGGNYAGFSIAGGRMFHQADNGLWTRRAQ